ncbi:MAG: hypothetical protein RIE24_04340 [Silicimonas sp.]
MQDRAWLDGFDGDRVGLRSRAIWPVPANAMPPLHRVQVGTNPFSVLEACRGGQTRARNGSLFGAL